jgi:hypothetical protein
LHGIIVACGVLVEGDALAFILELHCSGRWDFLVRMVDSVGLLLFGAGARLRQTYDTHT